MVKKKNPPANAGDAKDTGFDPWVGKIPGSGRFPGLEETLEEEMTTHSSNFAWKNYTDRGAWWDTGHGVAV